MAGGLLAALAASTLGVAPDARASASAAVAPALRSVSSGATLGPERTLRLTRPWRVKLGDVMLAGIAVRVSDRSKLTAPSGWRLVRSDRRGRRERLVHAVYLKVARVHEPGAFRWSFAGKGRAAGGILAYRGVDVRSPIDAHSGRAMRASRRGVRAPSVRTSVPGSRIVGFFAIRAATRAAAPRGAIERFDAASRGRSGVSVSAVEYVKTQPGATGRKVAKVQPLRGARISRAVARIGGQVALRPAAAVDLLSGVPPDVIAPLPDPLPLDTTITAGPSGTTTETAATFAFTSQPGALFECRLDDGAWAACSSPKAYSGLADGSHTFDVRATDAAGNTDATPASRTWIVARGTSTGGGELPTPLAQSTGATFHVATSGSDSNPGSADQPWATVQKAVDSLQPGQTAVVHQGTYTQALDLDRACTAAAPCSVVAAPGEPRPVLRVTNDHVLRVDEGGAYWRFRGFQFRDSNITSGGLVDLYGHHLELSGNELTNSGDQDFYLDEASHHVQLLGNWMHHSGLGRTHQSHGAYLQGNDHLVANNLIHDHPYGFGIQVYDKGLRSIVVNNTITHNAHSGIVVGGGGGVSGVIIRNNILAFNSQHGLAWDGTCPNSSAGSTYADHNVIYGNGSSQQIDNQSCPATDTSGGNRMTDPRFANPGARDLHLNPGSPAFDYALPEWAPAADRDGNGRPRGGGPDAGAYEEG